MVAMASGSLRARDCDLSTVEFASPLRASLKPKVLDDDGFLPRVA